ncbi:hypothetical protein ACVIGA_000629 [Bradyrhizobium sp. USDA 3240]
MKRRFDIFGARGKQAFRHIAWTAGVVCAIGQITQVSAQSPGSGPTSTTTTDAGDTVRKLLQPLGNVPWTHTVQVLHMCTEVGPGDRPIKVHCWETRQQTDSVQLTASTLRIVKRQDLQFDPPVATELPNQLTTSTTAWANCSTTQTFTDSENLQVSFQRSSSVAVSQTVSHAQSEQLNFSVKIYDVVTLGGNVQVTDTATTGTIDTNSYAQTVTRQKAISTPVAPRKAFGAVLETWPVNYIVAFHTVATVDGDLNANDKYHLLSDAISEDKRTFPISGTIGFVDAADGKVISYDIDYDFKQCPPGSVGVPIPKSDIASKATANFSIKSVQ